MHAQKTSIFSRISSLQADHYAIGWGLMLGACLVMLINPGFPEFPLTGLWLLVHVVMKIWLGYFAVRILPDCYAFFVTQGATRGEVTVGAVRSAVCLAALNGVALALLHAAAINEAVADYAGRSGIPEPTFGTGWRLGSACLLLVGAALVLTLIAAISFAVAALYIRYARIRSEGFAWTVAVVMGVLPFPIGALPLESAIPQAFADALRTENNFFVEWPWLGGFYGQAPLPATLGLYVGYAACASLLFLAAYALLRRSPVGTTGSR